VSVAHDILKELDANPHRFKDLHAHHVVLRSARQVLEDLKFQTPTGPSLSGRTLLSSSLAAIPQGSLAPPGVGAAAQAVGRVAPRGGGGLRERPPVPPPGPMTDPNAQPTSGRELPFNWRHTLVSFVAGFLVAALIGFQWQEMRRRRAVLEAEPPEEGPPAPPE